VWQAKADEEGDSGSRLIRGLVSGLLFSIPLWVCICIAVVVLFQEGPITQLQSAILIIAAAAEFVLLRHVWRTKHPRIAPHAPAARKGAAASAARFPQLKRTFLLLGVVGAYLHYYFWDVQLQIASMQSVTVFVSTPALG